MANWQDLDEPVSVFTTRNTTMKNLNTGKVVQHYSSNTKLVMVQKLVTDTGTFYRTSSAEHHNLNWAFEAAALGLPDEFAPSVPANNSQSTPEVRSLASEENKKDTNKPRLRTESHEEVPQRKTNTNFWIRLVRAVRDMIK